MIPPTPDFGRTDFRVTLWLFVWATVGGVGWVCAAGGVGELSAVFADALR